MKRIIIFLTALFITNILFPNEISNTNRTQIIQGNVTDKDSKSPLIGATIILLESTPPIGTVSDLDGNFILNKVPVGRQSFKVSFIGYKDVYLDNIDVISGKQTVLKIELTESTKTIEEVKVRAFSNTTESMNKMATVSARQFSIEESGRYAGARNDVSRMASNYAGVATTNDARNDIVIRGNSPNGQLWRLEGMNIPDPNHFSGLSSNGGAVSILNYNVIANSDFYTGAFPAEYGNASSGVFDLRLRNGNSQKHEHMFQLGALGTEFMTEGPIDKNGNTSYLLNYRFSTTSILTMMGIDFGYDGDADYQDASFKIHSKTKIGDFSFFGMGGTSIYKLKEEDRGEENFDFSVTENTNQEYGSQMAATGLSHLIRPNNKSFVKTTIGYSLQREIVNIDSISTEDRHLTEYFKNNSGDADIQIHSYYQYKFSARHKAKAGIHTTRKMLIIDQKLYNQQTKSLGIYRDAKEDTYLTNTYIQWAYKPNDDITITSGITGQYLSLNGSKSIEPRVGFKWQFSKKQYTSLGYGLHSQMQPIEWYFNTIETETGTLQPNKDLDFNRSHHIVAGYGNRLSNNLALKGEIYYQYLFNIPIDKMPSSFSAVNDRQENELIRYDNLVNKGIGRNYGVELTLERFMNKGMYFLITSSLYNSEYRGSDNIWRFSRYNGNYVFNTLAGKEFNINEFNKIVVDIKFTTAGGQRYTPIDEEASILIDKAVLIDEEAFTKQLSPYYRTDLKVAYRVNGEKVSHEFFINIDNLFNNNNPYMQVYDRRSNKLQTINQLGIFPTFQYKIMF